MDATSVAGGAVDGPRPACDRAALYPPTPAAAAARRKSLLRFVLTLPLFALAGGVIGALLSRGGLPLLEIVPAISLPAALLALVLSTWPHIVLHEAGHALAGIARGMRPIAFGIGPWRWERGQTGWRARRGGWLGGVSGFAALLPQGRRGLGRFDQMVYLAGGPLANLLTAAIAFAWLPWLGDSRLAAGIAFGVGACALLLGLLNLVPFHAQGWRSDGRVLLDLLRGSPDAALHQRVTAVMALCTAGVRPRDWPEALVPAAGGGTSPMLVASGTMLRLAWAMDRRDTAAAFEAARQATATFAGLPEGFRPHMACALAGHAARTLRDHDLLAAWRPLCEGGITDLGLIRAWLDAELAVMAGDTDLAATHITAAHALLGRAPDPVSALLLGEYLDEIVARLPVKDA